ncbi:N-6 DNA methylase [Georgenia sp. Z1491]|uniref:N-6 DNA methylase n=1 Tax=Georgenia sp. Z1491 TaxID=3416707 RepID=UPI003CEA01A5
MGALHHYPPQEVSEGLARITVHGKTRVRKVYDPAPGSGSLLLKSAKALGRRSGASAVRRST